MKLTRDNFGELLTPIHKKIFFESYDEKPEQYSKLFKVDKMNKKEETFPHMGAFGLWSENTEGNTINEDQMSEGEKATFVATRYDKGYELTWELVQDDLYNVMKGIGKGGSAKALGRGLRATIETKCADVINNGFSNTGYDGVALFSNSHPLADSASTCDNLITGALTDANMKAALTLMRNQVDEANVKIQAVADKAFCGPDNEYTLYALLKSSGPAGELSNDANTLPNLTPVIMDYINGNIWGICDSSIDNLLFMWRERPLYDSQPIPKTVDYFMYGYARWSQGYVDFRGLVASQG